MNTTAEMVVKLTKIANGLHPEGACFFNLASIVEATIEAELFIKYSRFADTDYFVINHVGGGRPVIVDVSEMINNKLLEESIAQFLNDVAQDADNDSPAWHLKDDAAVGRKIGAPHCEARTKSLWKEINNHHDECYGFLEDDLVKCICIDGYTSDVDNIPGEVIAKVFLTKSGDKGVIYINNAARRDEYAQEVISKALDSIKDKRYIAVRRNGYKADIVEWTADKDDETTVARTPYACAAEKLAEIVKRNPQTSYRLG